MAARVLKLDPRNDVATYYQALVDLRDPVDGDFRWRCGIFSSSPREPAKRSL